MAIVSCALLDTLPFLSKERSGAPEVAWIPASGTAPVPGHSCPWATSIPGEGTHRTHTCTSLTHSEGSQVTEFHCGTNLPVRGDPKNCRAGFPFVHPPAGAGARTESREGASQGG